MFLQGALIIYLTMIGGMSPVHQGAGEICEASASVANQYIDDRRRGENAFIFKGEVNISSRGAASKELWRGGWSGEIPDRSLLEKWNSEKPKNAATCPSIAKSITQVKGGVESDTSKRLTVPDIKADKVSVVTIERAIVSKDGRHALVFVKTELNRLGSSGVLLLLTRRHDGWSVTSKRMLWIS